jgi:hypothetical protein
MNRYNYEVLEWEQIDAILNNLDKNEIVRKAMDVYQSGNSGVEYRSCVYLDLATGEIEALFLGRILYPPEPSIVLFYLPYSPSSIEEGVAYYDEEWEIHSKLITQQFNNWYPEQYIRSNYLHTAKGIIVGLPKNTTSFVVDINPSHRWSLSSDYQKIVDPCMELVESYWDSTIREDIYKDKSFHFYLYSNNGDPYNISSYTMVYNPIATGDIPSIKKEWGFYREVEEIVMDGLADRQSIHRCEICSHAAYFSWENGYAEEKCDHCGTSQEVII